MAKFMIEVHHEDDKLACEHTIAIFLNSGSHFLTNADWGCMDGEHKAWFFLDVDTKEEALRIVPPAYRKDTKIIQLNKFSVKDFKTMENQHHG
jgi:hypothetical protein